jgi:hypothetical protein
MTDIQIQQVETLLSQSELDNRSQELMRQFFNSISEEPQFIKILDLLERFPSVFENFCKCFQLKRAFLKQGKTEEEWNNFLVEEDAALDRLEGQE